MVHSFIKQQLYGSFKKESVCVLIDPLELGQFSSEWKPYIMHRGESLLEIDQEDHCSHNRLSASFVDLT